METELVIIKVALAEKTHEYYQVVMEKKLVNKQLQELKNRFEKSDNSLFSTAKAHTEGLFRDVYEHTFVKPMIEPTFKKNDESWSLVQ